MARKKAAAPASEASDDADVPSVPDEELRLPAPRMAEGALAKLPAGAKLLVEREPESKGLPLFLLTDEEQEVVAESVRDGVSYSPTMGRIVCKFVAAGYTLTEIAAMSGMPQPATVHGWVSRDNTFGEWYRAAREYMADTLVDSTIELAWMATKPENQKRVRGLEVAIKAFQWAAERFNPRMYGQRGAATFVIPVSINTTLNLGQPGADAIEMDGSPVQNPTNPAVYRMRSRIVEDIETPGEIKDDTPGVLKGEKWTRSRDKGEKAAPQAEAKPARKPPRRRRIKRPASARRHRDTESGG